MPEAPWPDRSTMAAWASNAIPDGVVEMQRSFLIDVNTFPAANNLYLHQASSHDHRISDILSRLAPQALHRHLCSIHMFSTLAPPFR